MQWRHATSSQRSLPARDRVMGGKGDAFVDVLPTREGAEIVIADNGPPVSSDDLSQLFEPWSRARSANAERRRRGSALGLLLAREMVEALGGDVTVTRRREGAFALRVSLPSVVASPGERESGSSPPRPRSRSEAPASSATDGETATTSSTVETWIARPSTLPRASRVHLASTAPRDASKPGIRRAAASDSRQRAGRRHPARGRDVRFVTRYGRKQAVLERREPAPQPEAVHDDVRAMYDSTIPRTLARRSSPGPSLREPPP